MNLITKIINKINSIVNSNKYYCWYVLRKQRYNELYPQILKGYKRNNSTFTSNEVICIYNGNVIAGGLADRLRGIISVYAICKELGKQFKLYFVSPFNLEDYFIPHLYDWHIDLEGISFNQDNVDIVVLDTTDTSKYQQDKQYSYLYKALQSAKQIHAYTNAYFSYNLNYSELFTELFKPSERLQNSLSSLMEDSGHDYISISARFLNLLGDFNETMNVQELSECEQKQLLDSVLDQVRLIHMKNPQKKILANSDSVTFLQEAKKLEYVFVNPGTVTHIDAKQETDSYLQFEKTFLDFLMIANASSIYLLKERRMHKSGYPYAASLLYSKPFEVIEF